MSAICSIVDFDGATVAPDALQKIAEAAGHPRPRGIRYWREDPVDIQAHNSRPADGSASLKGNRVADPNPDLTLKSVLEIEVRIRSGNGIEVASEDRIYYREPVRLAFSDVFYQSVSMAT